MKDPIAYCNRTSSLLTAVIPQSSIPIPYTPLEKAQKHIYYLPFLEGQFEVCLDYLKNIMVVFLRKNSIVTIATNLACVKRYINVGLYSQLLGCHSYIFEKKRFTSSGCRTVSIYPIIKADLHCSMLLSRPLQYKHTHVEPKLLLVRSVI